MTEHDFNTSLLDMGVALETIRGFGKLTDDQRKHLWTAVVAVRHTESARVLEIVVEDVIKFRKELADRTKELMQRIA